MRDVMETASCGAQRRSSSRSGAAWFTYSLAQFVGLALDGATEAPANALDRRLTRSQANDCSCGVFATAAADKNIQNDARKRDVMST